MPMDAQLHEEAPCSQVLQWRLLRRFKHLGHCIVARCHVGISGNSARLSTLDAAAAKKSLIGGCTKGDSSDWTLLEAVKLWPRFSTTRMTRLDRQSRATAHCPSGWANIHSHSRPCDCMTAEIGSRSCNIVCAAQIAARCTEFGRPCSWLHRKNAFLSSHSTVCVPGSLLLSWEWRTRWVRGQGLVAVMASMTGSWGTIFTNSEA